MDFLTMEGEEKGKNYRNNMELKVGTDGGSVLDETEK